MCSKTPPVLHLIQVYTDQLIETTVYILQVYTDQLN